MDPKDQALPATDGTLPPVMSSGSFAGARVLIVDDDRVQGNTLAAMIERWGAIAHVAQNFSQALLLRRDHDPDLILLDVMMPHVDGYKMAQMFKRESGFVPVILLTALEDIESKRRGLAAGADEFLTKPVSDLELEIRLSSMLRIRRLAKSLEEANRKLADLATIDPLTDLANRRLLVEHLNRLFQLSRRYERPVACLMIDVDHFKSINDGYGHPIGDQVLRAVGKAVRDAIRTADIASRYGGEEFMVLAAETGSAGAVILGERIRSAAAKSCGEHNSLPAITASVGVATTELGVSAAERLVERADEALYQAKREGRNRVVSAR
jgi:diguanylate cyclase (GGDEF)-like protein